MHHTAHGVTVVTIKGGSKEVTKGGKNRDHSCGSRILRASLGGHRQEFPAEFSSEEGRRMTQKERTEPHGSHRPPPHCLKLQRCPDFPLHPRRPLDRHTCAAHLLSQPYSLFVRGSTSALLALNPASPSYNGNTVISF